MSNTLIKEGKFSYLEKGEGQPIILLHGLMGTLSNFDSVLEHFSQKGYKVIIPELPIYTQPLLKTNVRNLAKFLKSFIDFKNIEKAILLGNSLGGHIALYFTKLNLDRVAGLVLAGSSGLYEKSMGDTYPKRGNYEYIETKTQEVFYDPKVASKEMVDEVFETVNNRNKVIKTLAIAKSAIRHNMAKDLGAMHTPACVIWGKNDTVTPPEVAVDFEKLLPDAQLFWLDKCGHVPMMEHPEKFNTILENWLKDRDL
ncbi:Pimeloyl-ACP methyl ester carboxylesterase [Lutibacter oricola]|uniref:Pimeloyl-ACP methyl ester carboxylesterase n=1 Tax=Lutibacter oricola TaxID=762486 RepID=A0A1H3EBS5_9FLAO|nr:alpha/beta hydrolase [Lutibacter oricola]SDX75708.1 Pimeloyl-ACP methyl ester carboxylesterase [Lutibacter oricola]